MTSLFVNERCLRAVTPLVYVFIKCNYSTLRRRHLGGENQDVYDHGVFEPVTPDPVLTASPYKRQVLASVSTSHMERSIKSKISVLIDRQHWLKGQFNMQVIGDTGRTWKVSCLNPATSNNTKLVHSPLMGGLLHLVHEEGTGRDPSPPRPLLAVPNVTDHPSTANVPITVLL